ncbi:MAG: hypothetical protein ACI81V_000949 [Lentimonas sp.]|jgi:hypothetical protein
MKSVAAKIIKSNGALPLHLGGELFVSVIKIVL